MALLDRLGVARGVLVQPSVYGFDNRCLLDAVEQAPKRLLGIAVPSPEARPGDLERLHEQGVRGVRCNLLNPGGLDPERVWAWRPVLLELAWHVELHVPADRMPDLRGFVARFGVPVVVDHMGRPEPGGLDPEAPGVRALVDLVREGACYVKLSAPYRLSAEAPPWRDVTPLARALLAANPRACLWATDWPHTDTEAEVREEDLLAALEAWCPDARTRNTMLSEAPARLHESRAGDPDSPRRRP
jgi:predicted TIM-barrel fold metal-dependent hydrolase